MGKTSAMTSSDRLALFIERAKGLRRDDVEAIVQHLIDRLAESEAESWRAAA